MQDKELMRDLIHPGSLARIFDRANGKEFDYVFNCGGEKRFSQEEKVYELRTYGLSMAVGREAAKRKVKCFVEKSTGMVYKSDMVPRKETDKLKPSSTFAKWKLKAEEDLTKLEDLNLVIMRTAHVYGPYANKFLATVLCMARVYQSMGREMKWLWKDDMRTNTVHVEDVASAMWHAAEWYMKGPQGRRPVPVFNLVDHGNTCKFCHISSHLPWMYIELTRLTSAQGTSARLVADIFKIETGFHGTLISAFARLNLEHVVDDINDETLDPWAELQNAAGISQSTPLSPFMEKELLKDESLSLDGSAFEKETGFT